MSFFLGIDGGGSKTECVLADEAGAVLARATGPGANLHRVSPAELRVTLGDCLAQLPRRTAMAAKVVGAGFAGAADPKARAMAREVLTELLNPRWLYVVGDMEVALEAAVGAGRGVVLVAGTGSIAYGRNDLGQQARAGGRGAVISSGRKPVVDEGSGLDIGLRAVQAVWRPFLFWKRKTLLAEKLRKGLGVSSQKELEGRRWGINVAALTPLVVEAAREGDRTAQKILAQAGTALAGLAASVLRQLSLLETDVRVATSGGVFASEEVFAQVQKEILAAAPRARVEPLQVSPAEGAVRLAQRLWLQERPGGSAKKS